MKPPYRTFTAWALALVLAAPYLSMPAAFAQSRLDPTSQKIEDRDRDENGITVSEPRVYDDAQLQQRLQELEARLATLQVINQEAVTSRFGAVAGASQQISGFALNVQGAPVPEVSTTTKLPTLQTTTTSSGTQTVSNLATEDVTTKSPQFSPPPVTAPAPSTTLPSSFSVNSSDILDEMTQVQAEINGLRLLLSGDLSGHYIRGGKKVGNEMTKLKTTLGFDISVKPDDVGPGEKYKDAVAVVEVEVENVCETIGEEPPFITALLPREKTYNVAAIRDSTTSIGGGVATQILGFSGSWLRGHKTYYMVRDQDTVALTFTPEQQPKDTCGGKPKKRVGFMWQFRPVLGRRYARIADKTTFVQLALPVKPNAADGGIGNVTIRSYWRRYDRKNGVTKEIIPNSLHEYNDFDIPRYKLAVNSGVFNFINSIEDLGGGQILVKLPGRYLPGTNVRIGPTILAEGDRFKHRYAGIMFVAPVSDLATRKVFLVAHDGSEVPLELGASVITRPLGGALGNLSLPVCGVTPERQRDAAGEEIPTGSVVKIHTTKLAVTGTPAIATIDEATSRLSLDFVIDVKTLDLATNTTSTSQITPQDSDEIPGLLLTIGSRTFGYADSPLARSTNTLTAIVPSALLAANPDITLQTLLPQKLCRTKVTLPAFTPPSQVERLVLLEEGEKVVKFLLYGTRLTKLTVVSPQNTPEQKVTVTPFGNPADADRLLLVEIGAGHLKTHKNLYVQRPGEIPFPIPIPSLEPPKKPDPPKAQSRPSLESDEVVIEGTGLNNVTKVLFRKRQLNKDDVELEENGKTLTLTGAAARTVTAKSGLRTIILEFKSGAKVPVTLDVVDTKSETITR